MTNLQIRKFWEEQVKPTMKKIHEHDEHNRHLAMAKKKSQLRNWDKWKNR